MCRKKTAIIYGTGKRFLNPEFKLYILPEILSIYDVVGVCDRNCSLEEWHGYPVVPRDCGLCKYDTIIVTSDKYFEEIKSELKEDCGVDEDQIADLRSIEKKLLNQRFHTDLFRGLIGVEVGGPSSLFVGNIYDVIKGVDGVNYNAETIWWSKKNGEVYKVGQKVMGKIIIADAVDLSTITDDTYEFYISSNNLEHIANPIRALFEAKRIIREAGLVLIVVPDKKLCFDHNRETTLFSHIVDDFEKRVGEDDLTHYDEIVRLHDIEMDGGVDTIEGFKKRSLENFHNRCLHHHVFNEELLRDMFNYVGFTTISAGNGYGGIMILGRK